MTRLGSPFFVAATLLSLNTAVHAEEHVPGPGESASPSEMLSSAGSSGPRVIRQREARSTYRAMLANQVEDARYIGREIPLDIASLERTQGEGIGLSVSFWDTPDTLAPESMVVYFAKQGAMAPQWAAYQPAPSEEGTERAWSLFAFNPTTGLFDAPMAGASLEREGERFSIQVESDELPRRLVAFVETRSPDDEDWAWKDQAPTRRRGLRVR